MQTYFGEVNIFSPLLGQHHWQPIAYPRVSLGLTVDVHRLIANSNKV